MTTLTSLPRSAITKVIIPKEKFYQLADVTHNTRRHFIDEIEKIALRAVIAPRTMNISSDGYEEMHIIELKLKDREVNQRVLEAIDGVIPRPVLFILSRSNGECKQALSYKELRSKETPKSKVIQYYETNWNSDPLIVKGNSVKNIYINLIKQIEPAFDPSKPLAEAVQETKVRQKIQKQVEGLNRQIANELSVAKRQELARERYKLQQQIDSVR